MTFGQRVKLQRQKHGITTTELAQAVSVSQSTVSRWESGEISHLRTDKLKSLARALRTSTAYLLGTTDNPELTDGIVTQDGLANYLNETFHERLDAFLSSVDSADSAEFFGTDQPYEDILSGKSALTWSKAQDIADECGLPLAWLYGLIDDPLDKANIWGKALCKDGSINIGLLTEIIMRTEKIGLEEASSLAEKYARHFIRHDEADDELAFYLHNAPPDIKRAAIAVLKSALPANNGDKK